MPTAAIDELVAFWTYLHKAYKLRSANAIFKYLRSIADQFPRLTLAAGGSFKFNWSVLSLR